MNGPLFDFVPRVFFKTLAVTVGVLCLGWAGALWFYGKISTVDVTGSLICVPIVAYLVHLWVIYARDQEANR